MHGQTKNRQKKMTRAEERREQTIGIILIGLSCISLYYLIQVPKDLINQLPSCLCSSSDRRFVLSENQLAKMKHSGFTAELLEEHCKLVTNKLDCNGVRQCISKFLSCYVPVI